MEKVKLTGLDGHVFGYAEILLKFKVYGEKFAVHEYPQLQNGQLSFWNGIYSATHIETGLNGADFCDSIDEARREVLNKAQKVGPVEFKEILERDRQKIKKLTAIETEVNQKHHQQ